MSEAMIERRVKTNALEKDHHGCLRYVLKVEPISDDERAKRKARLIRRWVKRSFRLAGLPVKAVERGETTKPFLKRNRDRLRAINAMSVQDRDAIRARLEKRFC